MKARFKMKSIKHSSVAVIVVAAIVFVSTNVQAQQANRAQQVRAMANPYLFLIRDPAVHKELSVTQTQKLAIALITDELDQPLLAMRNRSAQEAGKTFDRLFETAKTKMNRVLHASQRRRLDQIILQVQGTKALLQADIADALKLDEDQRKQIGDVVKETRSKISELQKQAQAGKPRGPLFREANELSTAEQTTIQEAMTATQRTNWSTMLGRRFDVSKIGQFAFKAPSLREPTGWVNSRPLTMEGLRGKVVALHFYAFG